MNSYGTCLESGLGVEQDVISAARYFRKAADLGHSNAMSQYGSLLYLGRGVNLDFDSAARYLKMSADLGNPVAIANFAICLQTGRGVEKDLVSAARYHKMAADLGFCAAMYEYATCLADARGIEPDPVSADHYFRMAAESNDPISIWQSATRLLEGKGVAKDEEAAHRYFLRLESNTNVKGLSKLALMLRCGWNVRMDIEESLRWYRRCAELGDVVSLEHLGLCYEKGIGVDADLPEAARLYQRASELGSQTGRVNLGTFHWRGLGGLRVDRREAVRLWRLGGLDIPDSAMADEDASSTSSSDSSERSSRYFSSKPETEETGTDRRMGECVSPSIEIREPPSFSSADRLSQESSRASSPPSEPAEHPTARQTAILPSDHRLDGSLELRGFSDINRPFAQAGSVSDRVTSEDETVCAESSLSTPEQDSANLIHVDALSEGSPVRTRESFALCNSARVIESVVLQDGRTVREFLGEGHPALDIARLAGDGIHREGSRCLGGSSEGDEGRDLCGELSVCDTIQSLLRICAGFYTRNTFLYRRVNEFLRLSTEGDPETGRNLGLYIGLLRESFCFCGGLNPLPWECPNVVYRGASFRIDTLVDYARRPEELIRWQGFTSASRSVGVALGFPGNVLFEISLTHRVAALDTISAFSHEHEFILTPYQWFSLHGVRWDPDCGRWILSVGEEKDLPQVESWFVKLEAAS
jgi:TPR repeat protein